MSDASAGIPASPLTVNQIAPRRKPLRLFGLGLVTVSLVATCVAFAILMGFTPLEPNEQVSSIIIAGIGGIISCLLALVGWEIRTLWRARRRGRAAARLHIRIVSLFAVIAAVPAMIVAVVASFTLDQGLDRWFSERTRGIVDNSVIVAQAYLNEHARFLLADISAVTADYERLSVDIEWTDKQRELFLTTQARLRNIPHLQIIDRTGKVVANADLPSPREWPTAPEVALNDAASSLEKVPIFINPGRTKDLVGGIIQIDVFDRYFLYAIRAVDSKTVEYLRNTEANAQEYENLRGSRASTQIAFALLYVGVALVLLVSSVWIAINFADRLVNPIRNLMTAASAVSKGDFSVHVPVRKREGDIGSLSETFNVMTSQLRDQRENLLEANEQLDQRRRFIETVLAGVSAGVIGLTADGVVEVVNRSGLQFADMDADAMIGRALGEVIPELDDLMKKAIASEKSETKGQLLLVRRGQEYTLNIQITAEFDETGRDGFVVTLDDITDLVTAQRTSAWADVARRIAHEIKNPLTPIQLSAERLRRRFGKNLEDKDLEVFDKCTNTIVRQVGDIGRMVDEFSSFARMPKPTFVKADLRECLKEAVYVREIAQPNVTFTTDLPEEPLYAQFDERLLSQAITNLVKNAGEAIPGEDEGQSEGGKVHVRAQKHTDRLVIEISDNGKGWPKENRNQLLEPYMTTRKKGTGLGLAIVSKVVEEHGGKVELLDAPDFEITGRGAMVRITLPPIKEQQGDINVAA